MSSFHFARFGLLGLALGGGFVVASTAAESTPTLSTAAAPAPVALLDQHTLDKRTAPILKELKLNDEKAVTKVRAAADSYFQALESWHRQVDPKLTELWAQWTDARSGAQKDSAKATAISTQIDDVYASVRPQRDAFINQLATVLSPAQVEAVKHVLTREPGLERTYNAYLDVVPALTDAQKAFIRQKLIIARDEAMGALSKKEKIALFKKQKVQVEAYIGEQGYDWKKLYAAYAAKIKAQSAAAEKKD